MPPNLGTTIRLPEAFWRRIDEWRRQQPDLPSRPEALRRLAERALDAERRTEERKAHHEPPRKKGKGRVG